MHKLRKIQWVLRSMTEEPQELRCAQFDKRELPVVMLRPIPVHCRIDRVTVSRRPALYVSDTKTRVRHEVRFSDILQVSFGRMACMYSNASDLAAFREGLEYPERAFIHTVRRSDETEQWHMVKTIPPSELIPIYLDYYACSERTAKHAAA